MLLLALVNAPSCGLMVLVTKLRPAACLPISSGSSSSNSSSAASAMPLASVAVLKVPRTGSTWLAKELRAFPSVQLEFEPLTDNTVKYTCSGRFFTQALSRALATRLRCVTREFRAKPCYWAWQKCNASQLQVRPYSSSSGPVLAGFLINPTFAPGARWDVLLGQHAPRARLVWLRRTNLVKMALSDIKRLEGAASRLAGFSAASSNAPTAARRLGGVALDAAAGTTREGQQVSSQRGYVASETLLHKVNTSLKHQAAFPAAVSVERGMLVLYEDLQAQRLTVLRALFTFLRLAEVPSVARELERQAAAERSATATSQTTHWSKASEDLCEGLPAGNCPVRTARALFTTLFWQHLCSVHS